MELEREEIDETVVIRCVNDRLDAAIAVQFKDQFRDMVSEDSKRIILDMSTVQFMDSSGLGAVVAVYKSVGRDRVFDIAGLAAPVERVFRLTRMDSVFSIFADAATALASDRVSHVAQSAS